VTDQFDENDEGGWVDTLETGFWNLVFAVCVVIWLIIMVWAAITFWRLMFL
jgi:hypothetical protein